MSDRETLISEDSILDYHYVQALDRGGLKYPSIWSVLLAYKIFSLLQLLISNKYESKFLLINHQKAVLCAISDKAILCDDYFQSETAGCCKLCGSSKLNALKLTVPTLANIFLFNYTKVVNDSFNAGGGKKNRLKADRKLKTLTG